MMKVPFRLILVPLALLSLLFSFVPGASGPPPAYAAAGPQAQNVSVTAVSDTMLKVTWDAPTLNGETIDGYTVKYGPTGGTLALEPARASTDPRRELITGLTAATSYDVVVVTTFSGGVEASETVAVAGTTESSCSDDLPGARSAFSAATPSALFLGGNYIELGISSLGNFGTSQSFPAGFYGAKGRSTIGMSADYDGFACGENYSIDFFLPGSPEERWVAGYSQSGTDNYVGVSKLGGVSPSSGISAVTASDTVISNLSSGDTLKASVVSTIRDGSSNPVMRVTQVLSFAVNDLYFSNTVTLTNLSGSAFDKARFMRSFDPDNTVDRGGDYDTQNQVISSFGAGDNKEVVRAQLIDSDFTSSQLIPSTYDSRAPILFYSSDAAARASHWGFDNNDIWDAEAYDSPVTSQVEDDEAITMAFEVANLAPNASDSFVYVTSLDQRDFDSIEAEIQQVVQLAEESDTPAPSESSEAPSNSTPATVSPTADPPTADPPPAVRAPAPSPPVIEPGPVLRSGLPPAPPRAPTVFVRGRVAVVETDVPTTSRLDVSLRGGFNLGIEVFEDQGQISQSDDGSTELAVRKGASATLTGSGFRPGATVQVFMPLSGDNAKELTRIPVQPDGSFDGSAPFATRPNEVPLPIGKNVLQLVSLDNDGNQVVVEMSVNIAQGSPAPEQNRIDGVIPQVAPGQSVATSGGEPVPVRITPVSEQKLAVVEGDGWTMAINVAAEDGGVEPSEGGALLQLVRDESAVISGSGFMPGTRADVWLFSDPTLLGSVTVDENGEFTGEMNVDSNMIPVGEHTLQLQGVGEDGYVKAANLGVLVDDASEEMPTVVESASSLLWWIVGAFLLVLLFLLLLLARRRRSQEQ